MYPASDPDDRPPADLGGWRLVELLGRGGMGEVWRAEREGPGGVRRRAALKRILTRLRNDGELLQRFMAEARISSRLEHPNIVSVMDFGDKPEPYLVFEYVEGISAADLLQEASRARVKIPAVVAAFVCAEVASGLDYAHRKRDENNRPLEIVHRDVSPHNVLLSVEGAVKVGDFGVARAVDNTLRTRAGIQVGKLVYMAPEQAAGSPIDGRADVFSLGIVLWELLTLQPLFPRDDAATTLKRLQSGDIPPPSSVESRIPAALDQIVLTALAADRDRRFASAAAFAQALRGFVHSLAPGFDSAELIRILNKIAPAVAWHVATPPPVDSARGMAPQAPRAAAVAMPAMAMPAVAMPAAAPAAQPPAPTQPAPAPAAAQQPKPSPAQPPAPAFAPANPGPNAMPAQPPQSPSWHGVPAPPKASKGNGAIIAVAVVLTLVTIGAVIAAVLLSSESDSANNSGAAPQPVEAQTNVAAAVGQLNSAPTIAPIVGGTNSLTIPPNDVVSAATEPLAAEPDAGAEPSAPPSANSARASSTVLRTLAQHEGEFSACVAAPSGTRARVSLRLQFDGGARVVRFVEPSSEQLTFSLDAQQCLKTVAQRALASSAVTATVTVRWGFTVETRSLVGFEGPR